MPLIQPGLHEPLPNLYKDHRHGEELPAFSLRKPYLNKGHCLHDDRSHTAGLQCIRSNRFSVPVSYLKMPQPNGRSHSVSPYFQTFSQLL